jgi:hypothetical protein
VLQAIQPRLEITGTHLHSTLIIDDCVKSDEAVYSLEVTNELGSAIVDVPIIVVGEYMLACSSRNLLE